MTLADGGAASERKTIVFVDDDPMILVAMTEVLTGAGYEVHTARDGLEALALVRAVKPDYVILDVVLPKLDGGRLCAALRQDPRFRQIPIIAFSGLGPQDHNYFPQLSADAYVAKGRLPVAAQNLLTVLGQLGKAGPEKVKGEVLGYEEFRSRRIVSELLQERRHLVAILRVLAVTFIVSSLGLVMRALLQRNLQFGRLAAIDLSASSLDQMPGSLNEFFL